METKTAKPEVGERLRDELEVPAELSADFEAASDRQVVRVEEFPDGEYRLVHVYGASDTRGPSEISGAETDHEDEPDDFDEEPLRPLTTPLVYHLYKEEVMERYRVVVE